VHYCTGMLQLQVPAANIYGFWPPSSTPATSIKNLFLWLQCLCAVPDFMVTSQGACLLHDKPFYGKQKFVPCGVLTFRVCNCVRPIRLQLLWQVSLAFLQFLSFSALFFIFSVHLQLALPIYNISFWVTLRHFQYRHVAAELPFSVPQLKVLPHLTSSLNNLSIKFPPFLELLQFSVQIHCSLQNKPQLGVSL
jgi:hypothetical protein